MTPWQRVPTHTEVVHVEDGVHHWAMGYRHGYRMGAAGESLESKYEHEMLPEEAV